MARSAFALACCFGSLLAMSGAALADASCSGIVITEVIESASGELTAVGERCYERGPGVPFYYDAPGKHPSRIEPTPRSASVTRFEAATIQALGAQSIEDLVNPFPAGQGRSDFRDE